MNKKGILALVIVLVIAALLVGVISVNSKNAALSQELYSEERLPEDSSVLAESDTDEVYDNQSEHSSERDGWNYSDMADNELPPDYLEPTEPPTDDNKADNNLLSGSLSRQVGIRNETSKEQEINSSDDSELTGSSPVANELPPDLLS